METWDFKNLLTRRFRLGVKRWVDTSVYF
jgi:hypothetical protein